MADIKRVLRYTPGIFQEAAIRITGLQFRPQAAGAVDCNAKPMRSPAPRFKADTGYRLEFFKLLLIGSLLCSAGCTYNVVLENHPPVANLELPVSANIVISDPTSTYFYDVSSATAGYANTFRIEVGRALVQYADAFLSPLFKPGNDLTIEVIILGFEVRDFEAHINVRFTVTNDQEILLDKGYQASGQGYYARTFWGGAFAMRSSMRNTTREALTSIFNQFRSDAEADYSDWVEIEEDF